MRAHAGHLIGGPSCEILSPTLDDRFRVNSALAVRVLYTCTFPPSHVRHSYFSSEPRQCGRGTPLILEHSFDRGFQPSPVSEIYILQEPSGSFWMPTVYGTHVLSIFDSGRRLALQRFEVHSTMVAILYPVNMSIIEPHNVLAVRDSSTDFNIPLQVRFLAQNLLVLLPTIRFELHAVRSTAGGNLEPSPASVYSYSLRDLAHQGTMESLSLSFPATLPGDAGDVFALSASLEFDKPLDWAEAETDRRPTYIRLRERHSYDALWDRLHDEHHQDPFSNVGPLGGTTKGAQYDVGSNFGSAVFDKHNMLKAIDMCRSRNSDYATVPEEWKGQFDHLATCSDCRATNDTLTPLWQTTASVAGAQRCVAMCLCCFLSASLATRCCWPVCRLR